MEAIKKYITVPKNTLGIELCEHGNVTDDDNIICYKLTQERLDEIWDTGIIDVINVKCKLLIDDYESERIEGENIEKCLEILKEDFDELKEALIRAKEFNTFVDLDF